MRRAAAAIALCAGILTVVWASRRWDLAGQFRHAAESAARLGPWGAGAFALLYILTCLLLLPASAMTLAAGAVYGLKGGFPLVWLSATMGATASFLLGRYAARGWIQGRMSGDPRFAALDAAVGREGFKIVLLTRLSPVFPFNLLNYAFGLTNVRLKDYALATGLGIIPGTLLFAYLGTLARQAAEGSQGAGSAAWAVRLLGLAATVAATAAIARVAREALNTASGAPAGGGQRTAPMRDGGQ